MLDKTPPVVHITLLLGKKKREVGRRRECRERERDRTIDGVRKKRLERG